MQAEPLSVATSALRRFQRAGDVAPAVPTPERLLRAGGHAHIERSISIVPVTRNGQADIAAVKGARIRITTGPLERMGGKGHLDPDPACNAALLSAGRRYLSLWTRAGLSPLKANDPSAIRTTAVHAGLLAGERQSDVFAEYCAASDAMGFRERTAVDAIVLLEIPIQEIGQRIGRRTDRSSSITIGTYALRCGLEQLAIHFGMLEAPMDHKPEPMTGALPPEMAALLDAIEAREARSA